MSKPHNSYYEFFIFAVSFTIIRSDSDFLHQIRINLINQVQLPTLSRLGSHTILSVLDLKENLINLLI